jgi:hypothetical protein
MSLVPDITEAEQWAVETTLKECWPDRCIEPQLADVEIKMYPQNQELTAGPAVSREVGSTSFVIINVADRACRSPFYYRGFQQRGTGKTDYDDITGCVVTRLQVHADRKAGDREEST